MTLFGIVGWSGAGKTTLIEKVLPLLTATRRISVIKHAHRDFDIDRAGKDSHRFRGAGSWETMVSSRRRWALMHEMLDGELESDLYSLVRRLSPCDAVLVEGYKNAEIPKLEVWRTTLGQKPLAATDKNIVAVAADSADEAKKMSPQTTAVFLHINDAAAIADFIFAKI